MSAPRTVVRSAAAALCLATVVAVAGCGTEPADPDAPAGPTTSTSATSAGTPSASSSPSGSPSPSSTPSASPSTAADIVVDIILADGKTQPSGKKIDVAKGQTVRLSITSDHDDEVHVHGDYNLEIEVTPGISVGKSFVADSTGSVEVESHHPEKIIAILNIR